MDEMNALLERAEGLEDTYSRMVEMRQNVEKELRTSTVFPIVSKRAMEWKSAAEALLREMESLQDDGGKDQGRALAKIRLHVCLSTIYADLDRIYDEGSQNVHSRHKKKPARIKSIQDTLLSIVDASEDYDDEELQLDAVEALAILHGVTCYFEDLSKALIASFSLYPTKDKGIIFLESIEEQDVNNIFISTSNWAKIAPEVVHLEMDWRQRWYPEYARIYFWLVENAGVERIELARQDPSRSWPAPVVPPQRFHRALQLAFVAHFLLGRPGMHDKLQGIKVMWEASSVSMILQSHENACLLAARAATERHNLIQGMKITKAEARKVMDRLNDLNAACQESRFNSVSTYLEDAANLYREILLQDINVQ